MKQILAISFILCSSATSVAANIYDDCKRSVGAGDASKVNAFASTLRQYPNSTLDNLGAATLCVSAAEGVAMTFMPETKTWSPASEVGNGQAIENAEIIEQLLAAYLIRVFGTKAEKEDAAEDLRLEQEARLKRQAAAEEVRLELQEAAEARLEREVAEEAARLEVQAAAEEAVRLRICEIKELVSKHDKIINEAEAARQDRRIETLSATVQECSSWFDVSPKEALTNTICNSIFDAGGLPNSTITGPSQSEILFAELSKQNVETELEILVASGMLIEDFRAQYNSDETEDVYGCGQ